jgi:hypothetical protein
MPAVAQIYAGELTRLLQRTGLDRKTRQNARARYRRFFEEHPGLLTNDAARLQAAELARYSAEALTVRRLALTANVYSEAGTRLMALALELEARASAARVSLERLINPTRAPSTPSLSA